MHLVDKFRRAFRRDAGEQNLQKGARGGNLALIVCNLQFATVPHHSLMPYTLVAHSSLSVTDGPWHIWVMASLTWIHWEAPLIPVVLP